MICNWINAFYLLLSILFLISTHFCLNNRFSAILLIFNDLQLNKRFFYTSFIFYSFAHNHFFCISFNPISKIFFLNNYSTLLFFSVCQPRAFFWINESPCRALKGLNIENVYFLRYLIFAVTYLIFKDKKYFLFFFFTIISWFILYLQASTLVCKTEATKSFYSI